MCTLVLQPKASCLPLVIRSEVKVHDLTASVHRPVRTGQSQHSATPPVLHIVAVFQPIAVPVVVCCGAEVQVEKVEDDL